MKITTKLLALTLIPLLSSILLTCIIVYEVMHTDTIRRLSQVRSDQEKLISNNLKGRIETAWSVIEECFNRGSPPDECKQYMNAVRFGENDYVWVHRMDPEVEGSAFMVVHPAIALVNRDLSGLTDFDQFTQLYYRGKIYEKNDPAVSHIRPTVVYKELNAVCLKQGEGVVEYYWPKITHGKTGAVGYHKISYVKLFSPWNWVIGAGEYADHIDTLIYREELKIKNAQKTIYMTIFSIFAAVALFFGVLAGAFSKKLASSLDRSKQNLLDSKERLRLSEKRFMDMAFCSADFIWEVDREWNYCFVAGNTENILGYTSSDLIGQSPFTLMLEEKRDETEKNYRRLSKEKSPIIDHQVSCRSRAGETVFFLRNAGPITDSNGTITGYRGVDREITDRVREEEKRKILERELQVSQKLEAIGTLAAGIAHEINTPIQFIGDNTTFLSESLIHLFKAFGDLKERAIELSDDSAPLKQAIDDIEEKHDFEFLATELPLSLNQSLEGIVQVSNIVKTMKDFSHMGPGTLEKEDLNNAIETTVTISTNEWKYIAEMKTDLEKDLPPVSCFIGDIKQVILNLIINAAHTIEESLSERGEGIGCITIRTYARDKHAVIEVSDTGMGIPEDNRDKVFEHFFTTKDVGKGTGQGLAMAYQAIVEKHKGEIGFTTETGKGTTFQIKIPFEPA